MSTSVCVSVRESVSVSVCERVCVGVCERECVWVWDFLKQNLYALLHESNILHKPTCIRISYPLHNCHVICACDLLQAQTRSADEPMTTFAYCQECGFRWKVTEITGTEA